MFDYDRARQDYLAVTKEEARACELKVTCLLVTVVLCSVGLAVPAAPNPLRIGLTVAIAICLIAAICYALANPHRHSKVTEALANKMILDSESWILNQLLRTLEEIPHE